MSTIAIETIQVARTARVTGFVRRGAALLVEVEDESGQTRAVAVASGPALAIADKAIADLAAAIAPDLVATKGRGPVDPDGVIVAPVLTPATLPEGPPTAPHGTEKT